MNKESESELIIIFNLFLKKNGEVDKNFFFSVSFLVNNYRTYTATKMYQDECCTEYDVLNLQFKLCI